MRDYVRDQLGRFADVPGVGDDAINSATQPGGTRTSIPDSPDFKVKANPYWANRANLDPTTQAALISQGNNRYGAPIQYTGKKSTAYDTETRRAKRSR